MMVPAVRTTPQFRAARRFTKTPKGILLFILGAIAVVALLDSRTETALASLAVATATAAAVDMAIAWSTRRAVLFPSGGILTGLIVGLVLSPYEPLIVPAATATLAIASKHLFRSRQANVFNPAAFGLVASAILFSSGHSWWGAMPDLGFPGVVILVSTGWLIADRIHKLPLVLTFLGAHFLLFTVSAIAGNASGVAEVFRSPDLQAVLFFALFMLDDPPTCPTKYRDQAVFGTGTAAAGFILFQMWGLLYFMLAALLVANAGEALRRRWVLRRKPRTTAAGQAKVGPAKR